MFTRLELQIYERNTGLNGGLLYHKFTTTYLKPIVGHHHIIIYNVSFTYMRHYLIYYYLCLFFRIIVIVRDELQFSTLGSFFFK